MAGPVEYVGGPVEDTRPTIIFHRRSDRIKPFGEHTAVRGIHQCQSIPLSDCHNSWNNGNCANHSSFVEAGLPDRRSCGGIDGAYCPLAELTVNGGISASKIEMVAIPRARRNAPLTGLGVLSRYSYGM